MRTYSAKTAIIINAPAEKVWDALVNPDKVSQYMHGTTMKADWRLGGEITWSGIWNKQAYIDKGHILEYLPDKKLKITHWSPLANTEDLPENYHHITYELKTDGELTELTITYANSATRADADAMIANGWDPILIAIKKISESK